MMRIRVETYRNSARMREFIKRFDQEREVSPSTFVVSPIDTFEARK